MVGTAVSWLVGLVSAGVHEADRSAPLPSASSSTAEGKLAPLHLGPIPKRAHHVPTTSTSEAPKGGRGALTGDASSHGPL